MNKYFFKAAGVSLIFGSILACITMVLHPAGGDIKYIVSQAAIFKISHSIGIYAMPFLVFGFYGLSQRLNDKWRLSHLAFTLACFGLFSAALAALLNGFALPEFLSKYSNPNDSETSILEFIMAYGFSINKGLDFMFITSLCLAIAFYSSIIIYSKELPRWFAICGYTIITCAIIASFSNFNFISLFGFRIVVFGIAGWILTAGTLLLISKKAN